VPLDEDVNNWFSTRTEEIGMLILGKRFPEAAEAGPFVTISGMEQWIVDNDPTEIPWQNSTSEEAYYLGDTTSSGSWKIVRSGDDLKFQWYDGSSWHDGNMTISR